MVTVKWRGLAKSVKFSQGLQIMLNETPVQQRIRLEAGRLNVPLWRNNVGACRDVSGRLIRYGLANESEAMNREIKSSDLVGIIPIVITPSDIGRTFGVFVAVETKAEGWKLTPGDDRGQAQAAFHRIVQSFGGLAGFARSDDEFRRIIGR